MDVKNLTIESGGLLGTSVTLNGTVTSDGSEVWIGHDGSDPLDKSMAVLIDQPNLFMDYLANISFMVGGKVAFCLQGAVTGTLCQSHRPEFQFSIEPPLDLWVLKDGEQVRVNFSQPPFRVDVV